MPVMDCPDLEKLRARTDFYPRGRPLRCCRPAGPETRPPGRPVKSKIKLPPATENHEDRRREKPETFLSWLEDERRAQLLTWCLMYRNLHG